MNSEFDTWYTDYIDDENKSVREAAKAAWGFMQSLLDAAHNDISNGMSELQKLQSRLESLENGLKKANEQAEHFEREWYLRGDVIESLEKDAAQMRAALADIASGEVMRIHAFGPFATEQPEAATADDMMNRAASTLFFIDTAMQVNKG